MQKKPFLLLILVTAFLDILGMSLLIPSFPAITQFFGQAEAWSIWTAGVYSFGMFIAGAFFGSLSDKYGRRKILIATTIINILGYLGALLALHIGMSFGIVGFGIYILSRVVAGVGGAGYGVVQAYISDISSKEEKTKNMGLMGAAFGMAFLIGPAIGGLLSSLLGLEGLLIVATSIITLNLLWIIMSLPEPVRHTSSQESEVDKKWSPTREIYYLLGLSLFATIGFSAIQGASAQYTTDKYGFDPATIGYSMAVVGITAIIYQALLIKHVRKYLDEVGMMKVGLFILMIGLALYAWNPYGWLVFGIVILFPLGMGTIMPAISTLLSRDAGEHTGRVMGMNTSVNGIGGIIGPLIIGFLYSINIELPYWISALIFTFLFLGTTFYLARKRQ